MNIDLPEDMFGTHYLCVVGFVLSENQHFLVVSIMHVSAMRAVHGTDTEDRLQYKIGAYFLQARASHNEW